MIHWLRGLAIVVAGLALMTAPAAQPQTTSASPASASEHVVIFRNVRIFDGSGGPLSAPSTVVVRGNSIDQIHAVGASVDIPAGALLIEGDGRTLMPGLIDVHTHLLYTIVPQASILTADLGYLNIAAGRASEEMLMRGFTSVRDVGGPVFSLKRAIDTGLINGPRIWPSGLTISQTGGHGDFRLPYELGPAEDSDSHAELLGAIADSPDAVRVAVRQQLALGASQIKLMAGGGVSSSHDPLDVTQYSPEELRAAVEAAENWGTYVTVHAYTPRAIRQAVLAGVRGIEHGHLIDEATARLLAERQVWWTMQAFFDDSDAVPFAPGSDNRRKQLQLIEGTDRSFRFARQFGVRVAWGSDTLFSAQLATRQGAQLAKLTRWFTPSEVLAIATSHNAELLAMSGPRSPYSGRLGVVEVGALADLLLVEGDPTSDINIIADPERNFSVIMKDGRIYRNRAR